MAAARRRQGLKALRLGAEHGYDASAEALEDARVAALLEQAAEAVGVMSPANQEDYLHRMRAALSLHDGAVTYLPEMESEEP